MMPVMCRPLIVKKMHEEKMHPPDYEVCWYERDVQAPRHAMHIGHKCDMRAERHPNAQNEEPYIFLTYCLSNFQFSRVPQSNLVWHAGCRWCRRVFIREQKSPDADESFEEFCNRLFRKKL